MTEDLKRAVALLGRGGTTVALVSGDREKTDGRRGVAPLMAWIEAGEDFTGWSAADLVVGRAAALLYRKLGVSAVYGAYMSRGGQALLTSFGIEWSCGESCERILNREHTGPCPMDAAVEGIDEPEAAVAAIRETLAALRRKNA